MIQYKDGIVIDTLLRAASSSRASPFARIHATRTIGSLTCQATASQIGSHPNLLITLSSLACRHDQVAIMAAMAVKKIATHVRSSDSSHKLLLQALVTMSYSRATEVLKWTVRAYFEQSCFPHDRLSMIAHRGTIILKHKLTAVHDMTSSTQPGVRPSGSGSSSSSSFLVQQSKI